MQLRGSLEVARFLRLSPLVRLQSYTSYFVHVALTSFVFFKFPFFQSRFFYEALISYNKAIQSQSYKMQMSRRMKLCD